MIRCKYLLVLSHLVDSIHIYQWRTCLHTKRELSLIICSGDHQTGQLIGGPPKTKRSKGDLFLEVSEIVATDLFGDEEVETRHVALPDAKVWLLLHYHVVERGQQILRAELSRPLEANDGMITQWSERIILDVRPADAMSDDESANDEGPVIIPDVEIRF